MHQLWSTLFPLQQKGMRFIFVFISSLIILGMLVSCRNIKQGVGAGQVKFYPYNKGVCWGGGGGVQERF